MTGRLTDYKTIPALANYIDRIGAEQLNFKRFMVKEHKGKYYTEKCLIKIEADGELYVSKAEYRPSKEEKEQIKGALMAAVWPKSILAASIKSLLPIVQCDEKDLSIFWSRRDKGIIMVQQRKFDRQEGSKYYIPWTFWDDGVWRMMEPDGPLPFWKPEVKRSTRIMIHEGAKAAQHIDWMLNSSELDAVELKRTHPWAQELDAYDHWGIIGGALAPHRADYSELWHEKPVEVVYICDNDWPGKAALQEVSRHWGGSLKGVRFDTNWPPSFDLGDEFTAKTCPHLFHENGRYKGTSLTGMMIPATWATEQIQTGEKGRPINILRRVFREEWLHAVKPEVFIHKDRPNELHAASEFNNLIAPFSDVDDTARLLKKDAVGKGAQLAYEPGRKAGPYGSEEKGHYINTHVPSHIKVEKGSYKLWEKFLLHLLPEEQDRKELCRWVATLIARPEIKMHYGVLLVSETQGVGKTTLGNVLRPLIGGDNVSQPSEHTIVESGFNDWCAHKRLAICPEIYAGHSSKAYDKLKSVITDPYIEVSRKYLSTYHIQNWVHILANSNSMRALKISSDDRRWFVPKVTENKESWSWWQIFNDWIDEDGGLGKIKFWAQEFLKDNECVKPGEAAPWSSWKKEMIEEGLSPGLQKASHLLEMIKEEYNGANFCIADSDVVDMIRNHFYEGKHVDKLERPLTIRKLAKSMGFAVTKERHPFQKWGTRETRPKLICSSAAVAELTTAGIDELTGGPIDLVAFMNKQGKV
jgi:hypothetical protein